MVAEGLVRLPGDEQRPGPPDRVVAGVGADLLGERERVGGPADLQQRAGVHQLVRPRQLVAGERGGPFGVLDGERPVRRPRSPGGRTGPARLTPSGATVRADRVGAQADRVGQRGGPFDVLGDECVPDLVGSPDRSRLSAPPAAPVRPSRPSAVREQSVGRSGRLGGAAHRASAACRSARSALPIPAYAASRISGVAKV